MLGIATTGLGVTASLLLAASHGRQATLAFAGMGFAFAVEATGNLGDAQRVRADIVSEVRQTASLARTLSDASLVLYVSCAACVLFAIYRYRRDLGGWLGWNVFGLVLMLLGVYAAGLVFTILIPPLILGIPSSALACIIASVALRRTPPDASRAWPTATLVCAGLSLLPLITRGIR